MGIGLNGKSKSLIITLKMSKKTRQGTIFIAIGVGNVVIYIEGLPSSLLRRRRRSGNSFLSHTTNH